MSVRVSVSNKDGEFTDWIDRACFGFMTYISEWNSNFEIRGNELGGFTEDGFPLDHVNEGDDYDYEYDDDDDEDEEERSLEGFESHNLKTLYWDVEAFADDFNKGHKLLLEELPEVLKDPLFEAVGFLHKDGRLIVTSVIEGTQMDKTIVPLVALRNALYGSYKSFREDGLSPAQSVIMCNVFYRATNIFQENALYMQRGDGTLFDPYYTTTETLAAALEGRVPNFWQPVWGSNDGGYHRYGQFNEYSRAETLKEIPILHPLIEGVKTSDRSRAATLKSCLFYGDDFNANHSSLHNMEMNVDGLQAMIEACQVFYNETLELLRQRGAIVA